MQVSWEPPAPVEPGARPAIASRGASERRSAAGAPCARSAPAHRVAAARSQSGSAARRRRALRSGASSPISPPRRTPTAASAPPSGQPSSELYTAWAAMGLAAAGRDPLSAAAQRATPCSTRCAAKRATLQGAGDLERTILAAARLRRLGPLVRRARPVAEAPPARTRARRLVRRSGQPDRFCDLRAARRRASGELRADPRSGGGWLERQQDRDGGFGFARAGRRSDVDDTGAALQALARRRARDGRVPGRASAYLIRSQNPDGGFPRRAAANPTRSRRHGRCRG